jgi:hypothetical protein
MSVLGPCGLCEGQEGDKEQTEEYRGRQGRLPSTTHGARVGVMASGSRWDRGACRWSGYTVRGYGGGLAGVMTERSVDERVAVGIEFGLK